MRRSRLAIANDLINGGAAVLIAAALLVIYGLRWGRFHPGIVPLAIWLVIPFGLLLIAPRKLNLGDRSLRITALAGLAAAAFNGWAIYEVLIANPDPQSGCFLLFLPIIQVPILGLALVIAQRQGR